MVIPSMASVFEYVAICLITCVAFMPKVIMLCRDVLVEVTECSKGFFTFCARVFLWGMDTFFVRSKFTFSCKHFRAVGALDKFNISYGSFPEKGV